MKTFSHAVKAAYCAANEEIELFTYNKGPGVITEQWYTGYECLGPNTTIRYYVDDNSQPSIEMNLYMAHGIGFVSEWTKKNGADKETEQGNDIHEETIKGERVEIFHPELAYPDDPGIPWTTRRIGHASKEGGLYNTIRIPFQKSFKVTFITPNTGIYWYIIRGARNYPLVIGDLILPSTAKLNVYKVENFVAKPEEHIVLGSTTQKSGLLYKVFLAGTSSNFTYLEGCYRAIIDDEEEFQYLSSGTEDLFLSAFYFKGGLFHGDSAGVTFFKYPGTVSAYKFFEEDPVMFEHSFQLIWRCSEQFDNKCFKVSKECYIKGGSEYCKDKDKIIKQSKFKPGPANITSYVWIYEW